MASFEEEEIFVFLSVLNIVNNFKEREYWVHPINKKREKYTIQNFINELIVFEDKFYNFVRMSPKTFKFVKKLCEPFLTKVETNLRKPIAAEERLFITLRYT